MELSYDTLPLPTLFCLITLGFFPFIARQTHSIWRAVQAYDSQETSVAVSTSAGSKSKSKKTQAWVIYITIPIVLLGFFFSAGGQWQKEYPALAAMRNCIPEIAFMAVVPLTTISALAYALCPWPTAISRQDGVSGEEDLITSRHLIKSYKTPAQLYQVRLLFVSVIFAYIWMLQVSGMKYTIPLMAAAGLVFFLQACHVPTLGNKTLTFRMMCLIPLVTLAFSLAIFLATFAFVFIILTAFPDKVKDQSSGASGDWLFMDQVINDLALNQLMSLAFPFLWCLMMFSPLLLVGMAYRHDMTRAELSTLSTEEKEEILKASDQPKDKFGRSPVLLHSAALSKSTLAGVSTPTYTIAMRTLLVTLIMGLIVEMSFGWTGYTIMPSSSTHFPIDRVDVLSLWPLLAYPLMLATMLIRAKAESKEAFTTLWLYREDWSKPSIDNAKPTAADSLEEKDNAA